MCASWAMMHVEQEDLCVEQLSQTCSCSYVFCACVWLDLNLEQAAPREQQHISSQLLLADPSLSRTRIGCAAAAEQAMHMMSVLHASHMGEELGSETRPARFEKFYAFRK